jgi:hypothetical protein
MGASMKTMEIPKRHVPCRGCRGGMFVLDEQMTCKRNQLRTCKRLNVDAPRSTSFATALRTAPIYVDDIAVIQIIFSIPKSTSQYVPSC